MIRIYLTTIFFLLSINTCFSQIEQGKYYPKPELALFEGVWVGANSVDSLVIKLTSQKTFLKGPNIYSDYLVGKFKYYRNGQLVTNNFNTTENTLITGSLRKNSSGEPSFLNFTFLDLNKGNRGHLVLIFEDASKKVVTWKLRAKEGIFIGEKAPENYGEFSVPKEIMLKKIE